MFGGSRSVVVSTVCTPNGKTAEPDYQGHAAKAKERMGGKSLSGCRLELVRSETCELLYLEVGKSPSTQIMQI